MRALLVYPEFPDTFWSFHHALRLIGKKASAPPLGLLTVAAMLPRDWELRLVDANVRRLTDADLAWADCALVSAMVVQREAAARVISRCKRAGLTVIAGGPLFTTEPEQFEDVDHLVLNEAEVTLPEFLDDLVAGHPRRVYSSDALADLELSPTPMWELIESQDYSSRGVQYSRGCPHNCDFCSVTQLFGHRWRTKTAGQMITELDKLYSLGWRGTVAFVDDNLIGHKSKLKNELLPALIQWRRGKWGMNFSTQVTIKLADDEQLMSMMVRAGFDTVFVGIETLDDECLAECGKIQNESRDLMNDVRSIQHAGLQVQGGFIVGFDGDNPSVFERLTDFIQKSGIVTAMVGMLQAPVGTPLYERLSREGRISASMSGDNVDGTTNIIPRMSIEALQRGYRKIQEDLYAPRQYYQRLRTFLREYRPPRTRSRLRGWHIRAFFRSLYYLGMREREGFRYPGLLVWTLFRNPAALPTAVVLAISGYHFRRCADMLQT